jgi:adenosylhomocysteine nucleosidase
MPEPGDIFIHTVVAVATLPEQRAFTAALPITAPNICAGLHVQRTGISGVAEIGAAAALVSLGTAGALVAGLRSGDLLLPERVIGPQAEYPVASEWRIRLAHQLIAAGMRVCDQPILHSAVIVGDPAEKIRLHQATGASAVDMESGQLARQAAASDIPFLVVRVVVDEVHQAVPDCLHAAVADDGNLQIIALLGALFRAPAQLPGVIRMARSFGRARATLADVGRHGGEVLAQCRLD